LVAPGVPGELEEFGVVPGIEELLFTAEQGGKLLGLCAPVAGLVCVGLPVGLPVLPDCPEGVVCDGLLGLGEFCGLGVDVDELPELGDELCVPEGLELCPNAQAVTPRAQLKNMPEINLFFLILINDLQRSRTVLA
jgi:hypothetical protein